MGGSPQKRELKKNQVEGEKEGKYVEHGNHRIEAAEHGCLRSAAGSSARSRRRTASDRSRRQTHRVAMAKENVSREEAACAWA